MSRILGILVAVFLGMPLGLEAQMRGIVIAPFHTDSMVYGEAGQVIDFLPGDFRAELLLEGDTVQVGLWEGDVAPFDPDFTPAYVLAYFRQCEPSCRGSGRRDRSQLEAWQERIRLVQAAVELFPDHEYTADFRAIECRLLEPLDGKMRGTEAVDCADRFVAEYPDHPEADDLAWFAVRVRNAVYAFEGSSEMMIPQAEAFSEFVDAYPDSPVADQARSEIARLYYMVQEVSGEPMKSEYRRRADELYTSLMESSDESIRLRATIQRFNLRNGRRIYFNPNAWDCAMRSNC